MTKVFEEAKTNGYSPSSSTAVALTTSVAPITTAVMPAVVLPVSQVQIVSQLKRAGSALRKIPASPPRAARVLVKSSSLHRAHSVHKSTAPTSGLKRTQSTVAPAAVPASAVCVPNSAQSVEVSGGGFKARAMPNFKALHSASHTAAVGRTVHTPSNLKSVSAGGHDKENSFVHCNRPAERPAHSFITDKHSLKKGMSV